MAQIYEVFGYPTTDQSLQAQTSRRSASCPFLHDAYDGGGNRYASNIQLTQTHPLRGSYPNLRELPTGVCSIQLEPNEDPWIVCPRRMLTADDFHQSHRSLLAIEIFRLLAFPQGTKIAIWSEITLNCSNNRQEFNYRFDYVLTCVENQHISEISNLLQKSENSTRTALLRAGYTIQNDIVLDVPIAPPFLIEIMTSSTSGGNKQDRSTIPLALEDVLRGNTTLLSLLLQRCPLYVVI